MARKSGIAGLSNLRRVLRRLPADVTSELRETIEFGANMILRDARARLAQRSKRTSRALVVKMGRDRLSAKVGIIGARAKKQAYMARWIEFGTKPHSLKKGSRSGGKGRSAQRLASQKGGWHPGVPPHPFLFPAYEANKQKLIRLIGASVDRTLRRGAGKA